MTASTTSETPGCIVRARLPARREAMRDGDASGSAARRLALTIALIAGVAVVTPIDAAVAANDGKTQSEKARVFTGLASFYGGGGRHANGARYDPASFTAAHRTLPFGTKILVTELRSGRSVTVTVTDRGPFIRGRVVDLSLAAARQLRITQRGVVRVRVAVQ